MYKNQQIVAVMPARDEALSIGQVIDDIKALANDDHSAIVDRILVCDNGSHDNTADIASALGGEVIHQPVAGYGLACLSALSLIDDTDIVIFIDADASLRINESIELLKALDAGADLAIGARIPSWQSAGSMTAAQRFGNWLASFLIRLIWQQPVSDLGPFRAIRYSALQQIDMQHKTYGWTVEMQVKAIQYDLNMVEVPVHYQRRIGQSKISGTLRGVIGAGYGILSTILKLALNPPLTALHPRRRHS